jgi:nucleotide-binding universal stress UspA family protein
MFKKVLVAIDGSDQSRKAVRVAVVLAPGGEVLLVHSVEDDRLDRDTTQMAETEGLVMEEPDGPGPDADTGPPTVIWPSLLAAGFGVRQEVSRARVAAGQLILEQARRDAQDAGAGNVHKLLTRGRPAEQILEIAEQENADAIVLGSRGRSDFTELLFGSTSHKVLHQADRTCVVVR